MIINTVDQIHELLIRRLLLWMECPKFFFEVLWSSPFFFNIIIFFLSCFCICIVFTQIGKCSSRTHAELRRLRSQFILTLFFHFRCVWPQKGVYRSIPNNSTLGPIDEFFRCQLSFTFSLTNIIHDGLKIFWEIDLFMIIRIIPFFNFFQVLLLKWWLNKGCNLQ